MTVRMAGPDDADALFDLCVTMHAECAIHGRFDPERVREGLRQCLEREGGVVGVVDGDGRIEGGLALVWAQHWFTSDWHWMDRFCYVRPESRGAAWDELAAWGKWFVDQVAPPGGDLAMPLVIGVLQPERVDALCRLYRGKFPQVGGTFMYGNATTGRVEVAHGR